MADFGFNWTTPGSSNSTSQTVFKTVPGLFGGRNANQMSAMIAQLLQSGGNMQALLPQLSQLIQQPQGGEVVDSSGSTSGGKKTTSNTGAAGEYSYSGVDENGYGYWVDSSGNRVTNLQTLRQLNQNGIRGSNGIITANIPEAVSDARRPSTPGGNYVANTDPSLLSPSGSGASPSDILGLGTLAGILSNNGPAAVAKPPPVPTYDQTHSFFNEVRSRAPGAVSGSDYRAPSAGSMARVDAYGNPVRTNVIDTGALTTGRAGDMLYNALVGNAEIGPAEQGLITQAGNIVRGQSAARGLGGGANVINDASQESLMTAILPLLSDIKNKQVANINRAFDSSGTVSQANLGAGVQQRGQDVTAGLGNQSNLITQRGQDINQETAYAGLNQNTAMENLRQAVAQRNLDAQNNVALAGQEAQTGTQLAGINAQTYASELANAAQNYSTAAQTQLAKTQQAMNLTQGSMPVTLAGNQTTSTSQGSSGGGF